MLMVFSQLLKRGLFLIPKIYTLLNTVNKSFITTA